MMSHILKWLVGRPEKKTETKLFIVLFVSPYLPSLSCCQLVYVLWLPMAKAAMATAFTLPFTSGERVS